MCVGGWDVTPADQFQSCQAGVYLTEWHVACTDKER